MIKELSDSSRPLEDRPVASTGADRVRESFWVCAGPYMTTELIVSAPALSEELDDFVQPPQKIHIKIYNPSADEINSVVMELPPGQVEVIEVANLLESCGLESGLVYAHLLIDSPAGTLHQCRLRGANDAVAVGKLVEVSHAHTAFFPVVFAAAQDSLLCMVNTSAEQVSAKCRLFIGKRTPEAVFEFAPYESKVVSLEALFSEHSSVAGGEEARAYVRVSSKHNERQAVGVQLVSGVRLKEGGERFIAVS